MPAALRASSLNRLSARWGACGRRRSLPGTSVSTLETKDSRGIHVPGQTSPASADALLFTFSPAASRLARGVGSRRGGRVIVCPPMFTVRGGIGGEEPHSVASVGCPDGTSRNNHRPDGISDGFKVFADPVDGVLPAFRLKLVTRSEQIGLAFQRSDVSGLYHPERMPATFSPITQRGRTSPIMRSISGQR